MSAATTMERKTVGCRWKADDASGSLVGYASTWDLDLGGDVVQPGAFAKTIASIKAGQPLPLLADHVATTDRVLGSIVDADEDERGLRITARFASTSGAQDVRTLLAEGHVSKLSIGYEPIRFRYEDRDGIRVRVLEEVKLWETSTVVFPMNTEAVVTGVKSAGLVAVVDLDLALAEAEVAIMRLRL